MNPLVSGHIISSFRDSVAHAHEGLRDDTKQAPQGTLAERVERGAKYGALLGATTGYALVTLAAMPAYLCVGTGNDFERRWSGIEREHHPFGLKGPAAEGGLLGIPALSFLYTADYLESHGKPGLSYFPGISGIFCHVALEVPRLAIYGAIILSSLVCISVFGIVGTLLGAVCGVFARAPHSTPPPPAQSAQHNSAGPPPVPPTAATENPAPNDAVGAGRVEDQPSKYWRPSTGTPWEAVAYFGPCLSRFVDRTLQDRTRLMALDAVSADALETLLDSVVRDKCLTNLDYTLATILLRKRAHDLSPHQFRSELRKLSLASHIDKLPVDVTPEQRDAVVTVCKIVNSWLDKLKGNGFEGRAP